MYLHARRAGETREQQFDRLTQKSDGCWEWRGTSGWFGYGRFKYLGELSAHRVAWRLANNHRPIPDGLNVCHHCDNPSCVRPDHLFLGDQSANMGDAKAKGRTRGAPRFGNTYRLGKKWSDEERASRTAVLTSDEYRAKRSAIAKAFWQRPEVRAKFVSAAKSEGRNAKRRATLTARMQTPTS